MVQNTSAAFNKRRERLRELGKPDSGCRLLVDVAVAGHDHQDLGSIRHEKRFR